ncbi:hypothetical protein KAH94_02600 [bacterium]|nr:hypothetical protein [bacterium]
MNKKGILVAAFCGSFLFAGLMQAGLKMELSKKEETIIKLIRAKAAKTVVKKGKSQKNIFDLVIKLLEQVLFISKESKENVENLVEQFADKENVKELIKDGVSGLIENGADILVDALDKDKKEKLKK